MKTNIIQRGTSGETSSSFSWFRPKIHALNCHRRHRSFIIEFMFTWCLWLQNIFPSPPLLLHSKRKQFHAFCCCSFSCSVVGASSEFDCKLSYFYSVCWEMVTHSGILHKDNFVGVVGGWVGAFRHFRADILIRWCPLVSGWSTTSFSGLWWLRYYQEYPLGFPVDKLLLPRNHYDAVVLGGDGAIFLVYKIHSIWGGFCHTCYIEKYSLKKLKQSLSHKRYLHLVWVV